MFTCYSTPGKVKAARLCEAFAEGAKRQGYEARVAGYIPAQLLPGAAVFYGVTPETAHLWQQAKAEGRDWYYIDNGYFDAGRGAYYRITKNRLQHDGQGRSSGVRREALGVRVQPWRDGVGQNVVVCLQSDLFMETVAGVSPDDWQRQVQQYLGTQPVRRIIVRHWNADKARMAATLHNDLMNAALLVTWASSAAVEALLFGVPVWTSTQSAAHGIQPPFREAWANVLADQQWTLPEIEQGMAWQAMKP